MVEEVLAVIAHEIRNPLSAAINALYLLSNTPMGDEAKKYLAIAREQLDRASQITEQTLSFCRESRPATAINLRRAIEQAIFTSEFFASKKQVGFDVDVLPELSVHAVNLELVQILTNLVSNAIHHSPERAQVRIAAACQNEYVAVFVADDGLGVSPENASKLFQPFFTTNKEHGNGLGLWMSQELARRVGGEISLAPSAKGATFRLRLRPADAASAVVAHDTDESTHQRPLD